MPSPRASFHCACRSSSPPRRWFVLIFGLLAVAFWLCVPAVTVWVTHASGMVSLADVGERIAVMGAAFGAQALVRDVGSSGTLPAPSRRGSLVLLLTAVALLLVAYVGGHRAGTSVFGSFAGAGPWSGLYLAVFLTYMGYIVSDVGAGCWRYARSAEGSLRLGLRVMALGCWAALLYAVFKAGALVVAHVATPLPRTTEAGVGQSLAFLAGVLVAVGGSLPSLARRREALRAWMGQYSAYTRLYDLWASLMATFPGLALEAPSRRWRDRVRVRHLDRRLYRRVIEIQDARLALRDFLSATTAQVAAGTAHNLRLAGVAADAFIEAKVLEDAVRSVLLATPASDPWDRVTRPGATTADEVEWLVRVSSSFSPPARQQVSADVAATGIRRIA